MQVSANHQKLRNDSLWKQGFELVQHIYNSLDDLKHFPEERWTEKRLRLTAFDVLFYLSLATSNHDPASAVVDWMHACKNLFALQAMYMFACKQKFFELEPEWVLQMDAMLEACEARIAELNRKTRRGVRMSR